MSVNTNRALRDTNVHTFDDSFALAPDAQTVVAELISTVHDQFNHLTSARIACVLSQRTPMLHGAPCVAFIATPTVQGPLKWMFDWFIAGLTSDVFQGQDPDYLVVIDAALWPALDAERKERLLFHELCHVVAKVDEDTGIPKRSPLDGRILTKLVPHDFEFFDSEVRRYGPVVCGLEGAALALADGHRAAQGRTKLRVAS